MELNDIEFNFYVISLLREKTKNIEYCNVHATYPEEKTTFPMIVVDFSKSPSVFGVNRNVFNYDITIYVDIYTNSRNESIKLMNLVEESMLEQGFTYANGNKPTINSDKKYYISNTFKIGYNNISKKLERVI
ncbi:MAG: hypothetical protein R3Y60_01870 [bacterium]